ncbi:MAG: hypothetical protein KF773_01730 [Deltaproteobacteria bacterium]|nr:hypothetical protein [Deltaproteobacteria bacterium]
MRLALRPHLEVVHLQAVDVVWARAGDAQRIADAGTEAQGGDLDVARDRALRVDLNEVVLLRRRGIFDRAVLDREVAQDDALGSVVDLDPDPVATSCISLDDDAACGAVAGEGQVRDATEPQRVVVLAAIEVDSADGELQHSARPRVIVDGALDRDPVLRRAHRIVDDDAVRRQLDLACGRRFGRTAVGRGTRSRGAARDEHDAHHEGARSVRGHDRRLPSRSMADDRVRRSADSLASQPVRVAVLIDHGDVPAWVARVLDDLLVATEVTLVGIGRVERPSERPPLWSRLYRAFDARVFPIDADPFAPTDVTERIAAAPSLDLHPHAWEGIGIDVLLELSTAPAPQGLARRPKRGVWTISHGAPGSTRPGVDELVAQAPVTEVSLLVDGAAAYRTWSATDPVSLGRGRASHYWKASAFMLRALRELYQTGDLARGEAAPRRAAPRATAPAPRARELVSLGATQVRTRVRKLWSLDQWTLAFRADPATTESNPSFDLERFTTLSPPTDRFWADPFVARHGDGWVVLFEEKVYGRRPAWISALHIDRHGTVTPPVPVLQCDYHLSYPFLLRWQDTWWMVPETARNKTIELWRAVAFPHRWKRERVLVDGVQAVDPTLFEHDGRWWMFCNIGEPHASREDELHLFHATSPLGPWTPHPRNPIKSDIRSSRPAGRVFFSDGAWHRPAQDGSDGYGSSLVVHRIEQLDPRTYREVAIRRMAATGGSGLHTINACDGMTVIDVRLARPRVPLVERFTRYRSRRS